MCVAKPVVENSRSLKVSNDVQQVFRSVLCKLRVRGLIGKYSKMAPE